TALPTPSVATAATSGTLVYLKDANVWLANGDGSGDRALTTDGTPAEPYTSPSQSDGGIIAAGHLDEIVRMDQSGRVLNRMDPKPLPSSVEGHPVDGNLLDVAISPDGTLIAYTMAKFLNPPGASPGYRYATGYTEAARFTPAASRGTTYHWNPSWVGNDRTLQSGGYGQQVMVDDLGPEAPFHWFDDEDVVGGDIWTLTTDIDDAELSPDGQRVAAVRGYDEDSAIAWYAVNGDVLHGRPTTPTALCELPGEFVTGPTWSPDGSALAWDGPEGIWVHAAGDCTSPADLLVPHGSSPDWSPAPLAPPTDPEAITNVKRPSVTGTPRVGRTLTAKPGTWSPDWARTTFQWRRDGKPVAGADGRTYRLTARDRGRSLSVAVTAVLPRVDSVVAVSRPVRVRR
ncbi:MAG TPA: hypothetical protein VGE43_12945, partial [Acidimicrobiales bacterium]